MVSRVNLHPYTVDDSDSEELLELLMLGLRTSDGEANNNKGVEQFHMVYMLIIMSILWVNFTPVIIFDASSLVRR